MFCSIRIRPRFQTTVTPAAGNLGSLTLKTNGSHKPGSFLREGALRIRTLSASTACLGRKHRKARACALTPWWREGDSEPSVPRRINDDFQTAFSPLRYLPFRRKDRLVSREGPAVRILLPPAESQAKPMSERVARRFRPIRCIVNRQEAGDRLFTFTRLPARHCELNLVSLSPLSAPLGIFPA
jgi:hypothetical protein